MNENVVINPQKRLSDTALFWLCLTITMGIGLALAYSSGIFYNTGSVQKSPFFVANWIVYLLPPIIFLHLGLALFYTLREGVYTNGARTARGWTWVFWLGLFVTHAIMPFFLFNGLPVGAYIVSSLAGGFGLGSAILMYGHASKRAGAVMTVLVAVTSVMMIYLGYWAFA